MSNGPPSIAPPIPADKLAPYGLNRPCDPFAPTRRLYRLQAEPSTGSQNPDRVALHDPAEQAESSLKSPDFHMPENIFVS